MKPIEIKYKLAMSGSSQAKVSRKLKVSPQSVYKTINGFITSKRIALELSRQTEVPLSELFPDGRYT